jgi:hypothetical protein
MPHNSGWSNNDPEPIEASPQRINDATPEKVAEVLSRAPSGSLIVQDELAGWLGGFERYNTGQSPRAFYLTAWNGGTSSRASSAARAASSAQPSWTIAFTRCSETMLQSGR